MVTNNLPSNTIELIRSGNYYAIGIKGIKALSADPKITFIPFTPKKETGHLLIWRKNNMLAPGRRALPPVRDRTD